MSSLNVGWASRLQGLQPFTDRKVSLHPWNWWLLSEEEGLTWAGRKEWYFFNILFIVSFWLRKHCKCFKSLYVASNGKPHLNFLEQLRAFIYSSLEIGCVLIQRVSGVSRDKVACFPSSAFQGTHFIPRQAHLVVIRWLSTARQTRASSFIASNGCPVLSPYFKQDSRDSLWLEWLRSCSHPWVNPWGQQDPNKLTSSVTSCVLVMGVVVGNMEPGSLDHMDPQIKVRNSWHVGKDAATINVIYNLVIVETLGSTDNWKENKNLL